MMFVFSILVLCHFVTATVFINELDARGDDWLELFNSAATNIDLSGWILNDEAPLKNNTLSKDGAFTFPQGTIVAGRSVLVVAFADPQEGDVAAENSFKLSANGETVTLADQNGVVVDSFAFLKAPEDGSFARIPDGGVWTQQPVASRGALNGNGTGDVIPVVVRPEGWTEESHGARDVPDYAAVFGGVDVPTLELVFDDGEWERSWEYMVNLTGPFGQQSGGGGGGGAREMGMAAGGGGNALDLLGGEPLYVRATLKFLGRVWTKIAFRFKGNSSLKGAWSSGSYKIGFRIDTDRYDDDFPAIQGQTLFGFEKMTFSSNFGDATGFRELFVNELYRSAGSVAAQGRMVRVTMHGRDVGLYTMLEDVSEGIPKTLFDDVKGDGSVFKPDGDGARLTLPLQEDAFPLKSGSDKGLQDLQQVLDVLHDETRTSNPAAWRKNLQDVFDVKIFCSYLAVTRLTNNWDQYGYSRFTHNYYLYTDLPRHPMTWIAWDSNFALGTSTSTAGGGGDNMGGAGSTRAPRAMTTGAAPAPGGTMPTRMPMQMGGGGGGGGPGGNLAMDLSGATGKDWPLIAFVRDDPIFFGWYVDAVRMVLSETPYGNPDALKIVFEEYREKARSDQASVDTLMENVAARVTLARQFLSTVDKASPATMAASPEVATGAPEVVDASATAEGNAPEVVDASATAEGNAPEVVDNAPASSTVKSSASNTAPMSLLAAFALIVVY